MNLKNAVANSMCLWVGITELLWDWDYNLVVERLLSIKALVLIPGTATDQQSSLDRYDSEASERWQAKVGRDQSRKTHL